MVHAQLKLGGYTAVLRPGSITGCRQPLEVHNRGGFRGSSFEFPLWKLATYQKILAELPDTSFEIRSAVQSSQSRLPSNVCALPIKWVIMGVVLWKWGCGFQEKGVGNPLPGSAPA